MIVATSVATDIVVEAALTQTRRGKAKAFPVAATTGTSAKIPTVTTFLIPSAAAIRVNEAHRELRASESLPLHASARRRNDPRDLPTRLNDL